METSANERRVKHNQKKFSLDALTFNVSLATFIVWKSIWLISGGSSMALPTTPSPPCPSVPEVDWTYCCCWSMLMVEHITIVCIQVINLISFGSFRRHWSVYSIDFCVASSINRNALVYLRKEVSVKCTRTPTLVMTISSTAHSRRVWKKAASNEMVSFKGINLIRNDNGSPESFALPKTVQVQFNDKMHVEQLTERPMSEKTVKNQCLRRHTEYIRQPNGECIFFSSQRWRELLPVLQNWSKALLVNCLTGVTLRSTLNRNVNYWKSI